MRLLRLLLLSLAALALPAPPLHAQAAGREPDLSWRAVATGRLDADAAVDLVWRHDATGELRAWLMNGAAKAAESRLSPEAVPDLNWRLVGAADFDGDGRTDLAWRHQLSGRNVGLHGLAAARLQHAARAGDGGAEDALFLAADLRAELRKELEAEAAEEEPPRHGRQ